MKKLLIALLIVLAAGFAFLRFFEANSDADDLAPALQQESEQTPPDEAELAELADEVEHANEPDAEREVASPEPQESAPIEAAASVLWVEGRVVLVDETGTEDHHPDGELTFVRWVGNSGGHTTVDVEDGAFRVEVSGIEHLTINEVTLSDRGAILENQAEQFPTDGSELLVRCVRPKRLILNVVDGVSGSHLSRVTLLPQISNMGHGKGYPGETRGAPVLTNGVSPIELQPNTREASSDSTKYFVHVAGYAWQAVDLKFSAGGEREVRLEAGGDLRAVLVGDLPKRGTFLRLWSGRTSGPFAEVSVVSNETVELEALPPGSYRLSVEVGKWYSDPVELGTLQVEIIAGEQASHELVLEQQQVVQKLPFAGTLVLPSAWELDFFRLKMEYDGSVPDGSDGDKRLASPDMTKVEGEVDTWAFDFGSIASGTYTLELASNGWPADLEYTHRFELSTPGIPDFHFVIPPPADVIVRLIDSSTGERAEVDSMHWGASTPESPHRSSLVNIALEEDQDYFAFRAPVGEISLGSFGTGFTSVNEEVQIQLGENEFSYRLDRDCPLVIQLFDGETQVSFPDHWWPEPEHIDGEGKCLYISNRDLGFMMGLSEPGRYRFELPEIPHYAAIPVQEITVKRAEDTVHKVQLERE
ncbi:MAG: hypothetical protein ACI841_000047 [Planctomycetota bacterium]|jgi:hypothetical protein